MGIRTDSKEFKNASKYLSKVLRHQPELMGLSLEPGGWAPVGQVLDGMKRRGHLQSREELDYLVSANDKTRFAFDSDGTRIRANQGHSVTVDLDLEPIDPPDVLYHGTHAAAVDAIRREGLRKMNRHHVHLSRSFTTAVTVGSRRGRPIVFRVNARVMAAAGHVFFCSENGVWLTDHVPVEHLTVAEVEE